MPLSLGITSGPLAAGDHQTDASQDHQRRQRVR